MKKGIFSSIFGIAIFFIVFYGFFAEESTFLSSIPIWFFAIFIGGIISFPKKAKRTENTKEHSHHNDYDHKIDLHEQETSETLNAQTYSKRCHKCGSLISSKDTYCPECGASQKNTIICEYCGHENPASNALCEKCNGFL